MLGYRERVSTFELAAWLRHRSDDELMRLLSVRPDLLHPVPADIDVLAARASGRASLELALERLDTGALQLLEAVLLLSRPPGIFADDDPAPSSPAAAELLGVDVAELARALPRLREAALVWDDADGALHVPSALHEVLPWPASLGPPAASLFAELPASWLTEVATNLATVLPASASGTGALEGGTPGGADGGAALALNVLTDPVQLGHLLAATPGSAREVLELLAAGPPVGSVVGARRRPGERPESPIRWLLGHGLLVPLDDYTVALPREVGTAVRGGRPFARVHVEAPPLDLASNDPAQVDAIAAAQAFTVVRLVESFLERWAADPPAVLRSGGLGVRDLRRTARELDVDESLAALLVELSHATGLLASEPGVEPRWLPTPAFDAWSATPVATRWVTLANAWLSMTRVPALVGRRAAAGDDLGPALAPGPDRAPNALGADVDRAIVPVLRREMARLWLDTVPGSAASPESLVSRIAWNWPRRGGQLRDDLVAWSCDEAATLGITGKGAVSSFARPLLRAFGGEDAGGEPAADTGSAEALEPLLPQPVDHVLLQADLTAIAPGPLQPAVARTLASMAAVESTGGATVYRFSESSLRNALDAGRSASELHDFLTRHASTDVPQPLTYLIDDVARRYGRIRIGAAGAYVRCDDEALLAEVLADRRAESLRLRKLAPSVLVSPLAPERVAERLRELGYAPAAEDSTGALLLQQSAHERAPARPRPPQYRVDLLLPKGPVVLAAVRALRNGDRAAQLAREQTVPDTGAPPSSGAAYTLAVLHDAVVQGTAVWMGYLNAQGQASKRIVEPLRLAGGYLTAFDHRHDEVRTFAVHRITGIAPLEHAGGAAAADWSA